MQLIFYSMPKLLKLSENNVDKAIKLLENYKENKNRLLGDSYLLRLDKLLEARASNLQKIEYLYFAAFRSYADYKLLGIKYLDLSYIPDIDTTKAKGNALMSTINNQIKFIKE